MQEKIIYSISVEDIFTVADDSLDRKPTKREIKFVQENIADRIPWFDVIEELLNESKSKSSVGAD